MARQIKEMVVEQLSRRHTQYYLTDWYCPICGEQDCWQPVGEMPDYYQGCSMVCQQCGHVQYGMDCIREGKNG